ncbi:MAG TPA: alpha-ketoglutarate-dependent dioxygenase AlkB [Tepidisphaeraceae bacterium]|nr:alpha-ketoglutarate-dependent dioxygenase AlkB [Tepidisphaeraceae bacterium]
MDKTNELAGAADADAVAGLRYLPAFIETHEHDELMRQIDSHPWLSDLRRRVQHYGFRYDYSSRRITASMVAPPFPEWAAVFAARLADQGLAPEKPDQLIINEYLPGQGIAGHVDCVPCFSETIISMSLGSACVMEFTNGRTNRVVPVLLEPRGLVIMQGEARFDWKHGIRARKTDNFQGQIIRRARRVSLTFRKVILVVDG